MPEVFREFGFVFFFYANEGNEPIHVHCQRGDTECKYWLDRENFNVEGTQMQPCPAAGAELHLKKLT